MRREVALILLSLVTVQGCATGRMARQPLATGGGPPDFEAINRALSDQPATVELKTGEQAKDVENVRMTAESTSWLADDRERTVATAEVSSVTRQVRRRLWSGFGWGALAGLPVAYLVANQQSKSTCSGISCSGVSDSQVVAFVLTDLACGMAGMVISGAFRQPQVVYLATPPRAAAAAGAPGAQSASAIRHCRLAAEPSPPGSPAIECAPRGR